MFAPSRFSRYQDKDKAKIVRAKLTQKHSGHSIRVCLLLNQHLHQRGKQLVCGSGAAKVLRWKARKPSRRLTATARDARPALQWSRTRIEERRKLIQDMPDRAVSPLNPCLSRRARDREPAAIPKLRELHDNEIGLSRKGTIKSAVTPLAANASGRSIGAWIRPIPTSSEIHGAARSAGFIRVRITHRSSMTCARLSMSAMDLLKGAAPNRR